MQFAADTPINRASVKELSIEELEKLVERMQERRMRSYTAYQELMEAKAKIKQEKDHARYVKVLDMAGKKLEAAEKALEAASKYVNELKVLQLMLGE
jgi:vacuolar-type H+-ATPase subunit I/STV1